MPQPKMNAGKMVKAKATAPKKAVKPTMAKEDMKKGAAMTPKEKFLEMIKAKKKKK